MEIGRYVACFLRSGESLINTRVVWFVTDCRGAGRKKDEKEGRKEGKLGQEVQRGVSREE